MSTGPEPGSCGKAQHWRLRPLERKGAMGHRDMGLEPRPSWAARVRATVLRDSPGLGHRHPAPSSSQVRPADGHQHNSTSSSPKSRVLRQLYTLPEKGVRARVGTHPATSSLSRDRPTTPLPHKGQEGGAPGACTAGHPVLPGRSQVPCPTTAASYVCTCPGSQGPC